MAEKVHLSNLNEAVYEKSTIKPLLTSRNFNDKENKLMYELRSRYH